MTIRNRADDRIPADAGVFRTTRWTMVIRASDGAQKSSHEALGQLCEAYWFPLYCYARRKGRRPEDAQDLTQAFFESIIESSMLSSATRERGKFRTFLLSCFSNFLHNEWEHRCAHKRGGSLTHLSIDANEAESRYAQDPVSNSISPDEAYDRNWAETLVQVVLEKLRAEYEELGQLDRFDALSPCLMGEVSDTRYRDAGEKLGLSEGGVKTTVRRMRLRFRDLLRAELSETMDNPSDAEVDEEIRFLLRSLG
jgi:RNA polymerase sigma-70 factor (ECF subfamily)